MIKFIQKEDFDKFVSSLTKKYPVIIPVMRDSVRFEYLCENDKIVFESPLYPAKKFFFPVEEILFRFKKEKTAPMPAPRTQVLFVNRIDANAILCLDKIFLSEPADECYKKKRESTIIVEIPMAAPENSFTGSFNLEDNFDIKLQKYKNGFLAYARTKQGKELMHSKLFQATKGILQPEKIISPKKMDINKAEKIDRYFTSPIWQKNAKLCLSCTACTAVCPTCSCFFIKDNVELEITNGKRKRKWSSCQIKPYSEVAGGYAFRAERDKRVKHRIYCKLEYFQENFKIKSCVGCGRCITACPAGIDMTQMVDEL